MKLKLSVSMDKDLIDEVEGIISEGRFRNKSHIIEYALKSFLKRGEK
jgi:metal-responsive CopG/Arc/MetJ family transcriptional regulator